MDPNTERGLRNLLIDCAGVTAGQRLLIVREDPALGWYDAAISEAVAAYAGALGLTVEILPVGGPQNVPLPGVAEAVDRNDVTLFLARIGDQGRFEAPPPGKTLVMSYVRDIAALSSAYAGTPHGAMVAVKAAVNRILLDAETIRFTCPRGTDMVGHLSAEERRSDKDVGMRRFPMGVHQPIPARGFAGRVALSLPLTPTGSRVYDPPCLPIEAPVIAEVAGGRIGDLDGPADLVARIRAHYATVADKFSIAPDIVHSWHAGLHPANGCSASIHEDADRWSNSAFTNPRFLHLHTCGDYPPGEITWMVLDPSVEVDGRKLWQDGALRPQDFLGLKACLEDWPELVALYGNPAQRTGL